MLGSMLAKLAEVLSPLLIVRLLGKAEVGAFAALLLIYETFAVVLGAGVPDAVLYFTAGRSPEDRRGVIARLAGVMLGSGALLCGVMVGVGLLYEPIAGMLGHAIAADSNWRVLTHLPLLGVYALLDLPTRMVPNAMISEGQPRRAALIAVTRSIFFTSGVLIPAALGWGVGGVAFGLTCAGALQCVVVGLMLSRVYGGRGLPASVPTVREIIRYCGPLGVTQITNKVNQQLDRWLVIALFPIEALAIYQAGAYQLPFITNLASATGAVYLGRFSTLYREGKSEEVMELWRGTIRKLSLLAVPAGLVFIVSAEEFMTVAFGEEYRGAGGVFRAYNVLVLGRVAQYGAVMLAAGRPDYVMRASAMTLVTNICISVPLTLILLQTWPEGAIYGPAIGTAVAFGPTLLYYNQCIAWASKLSLRQTFPLRDWLKVLAVAGVPALLATAVKFTLTLHPALMLGIEAAIVVLGWAALGSLTGLVSRADWVFAIDWLRFRDLRRRPGLEERATKEEATS